MACCVDDSRWKANISKSQLTRTKRFKQSKSKMPSATLRRRYFPLRKVQEVERQHSGVAWMQRIWVSKEAEAQLWSCRLGVFRGRGWERAPDHFTVDLSMTNGA